MLHFLRQTHHAVLYTAIKELVTDANFVCSEEGIKLQAMDNSHVALVAVHLYCEGFVHYRCDHPMPLGVNLASFTKVLKCAKDDDRVALTATDAVDVLKLTYEAKSTLYSPFQVADHVDPECREHEADERFCFLRVDSSRQSLRIRD